MLRRVAVLMAGGVLLGGAWVATPAAATVVGTSVHPSVSATAADQALATRLVNRFFRLLHAKDAAGLRAFLSPAFQVERADGTGTDKARYLANPPKVDTYEITGLKATRHGDVLVARYSVVATEQVNGTALKKNPAPRLSTFAVNPKTGTWQLLSHANFNPVAPPA